MSYRNPERIVDTQSGQYFRNMQASLAKDFTDAIDQDTNRKRLAAIKANEDQQKTLVADQKKDQATRSAALQVNQKYGTSVNWTSLSDNLRQDAEIQKIPYTAQTEEQKNHTANMANISGFISDPLASLLAYQPAYNLVLDKGKGREGGLNQFSTTNADKLKGFKIFFDGQGGNSVGNFNAFTGESSVSAFYKDENGADVEVVKVNSNGADIELDTVPDMSDKKTAISKRILESAAIEKGNSPLFEGAIITDKGEQGTGITRWSRRPTREAAINVMYEESLAEVMSMTGHEQAVWYNNIVVKDPNSKDFILDEWTDAEKYVVDEKTKQEKPRPEIEKIARAFANNILDTVGEKILYDIEYAGVGKPTPTQPTKITEAEIKRDKKAKDLKADTNRAFELIRSGAPMNEVIGRFDLKATSGTDNGLEPGILNPITSSVVTIGSNQYTFKDSDTENKKVEKMLKAKGYSTSEIEQQLKKKAEGDSIFK